MDELSCFMVSLQDKNLTVIRTLKSEQYQQGLISIQGSILTKTSYTIIIYNFTMKTMFVKSVKSLFLFLSPKTILGYKSLRSISAQTSFMPKPNQTFFHRQLFARPEVYLYTFVGIAVVLVLAIALGNVYCLFESRRERRNAASSS